MPHGHKPDSNRALNDVLVTLERSLPMYLRDATPWVAFNHAETKQVLDRIVADNRQNVARLTALLNARRHTIDRGEFPMDFTSLHDLSLDFLVSQLIDDQRRDTQIIEDRLGRMTHDAEGQNICADVVAAARGHLQSLESTARQPARADGAR